ATLDSPEQGALGIPVESVSFEEGLITLDLPALNASYEATLTPDGTLEGVWRQGGMEAPLYLSRTSSAPALSRPQHPEPPFPYGAEEVRFANAEGIQLAGTLTLPT